MKAWKIALLLSYISIASMSSAIITPALPLIREQFHITQGALEWVVSIFLLGYMLGQIIYGPLANRIGRLSALRVGLSVNLVGIILCLLATYFNSYSLLLSGRLITALGASAGLSCTFILLNESLTPERAKHALAYAVIMFTLGIGLAVLVGGIVSTYLAWQACFAVLFLHGLFMFAATFLFEETLREKKSLHILLVLQHYTQALCHKALFTYALFVALVSVFSYCYSVAAPLASHELLGLSAAGYGYWNIINMLGMLLGGLAAARLIKQFSEVTLLVTATGLMLLLTLLLAVLLHWHYVNTLVFFSISAMMYFLASIIFPAASHRASNAISDKANASGAMNLINMGSAVFSVTILGYLPLSQLSGFIIIMLVFMILCLVCLCVFNAGNRCYEKNFDSCTDCHSLK